MCINARNRERRRELVLEHRQRPCADCGRDDLPPEAMDLDHVPERGPKLFDIGTLAGGYTGMAKLKAELAKCDTVCPTCHRLRTIRRMTRLPGDATRVEGMLNVQPLREK